MGGEHFLFWEASGPLHFDRSGTLNKPAQLSQCPRCFRFSTPLVHLLTKVSRLCFAQFFCLVFALSVFVFCFCALAGSAVPALVSLPSSLGTLLCAVWFCALAGSAVRRNKYSSSQCCSSLLYLAPPPPAPPLPMKILVLGLFCGRPAANQHVFKTECSFKTEKDGRNSSRLPPRLLYPSTTRMQNRCRINTVAIRHRYSHLRRAFTAWCSDRQSQFTTLQTHDFVNRLGTVHAERNFAGNKVPSRSNEALGIRKRKP